MPAPIRITFSAGDRGAYEIETSKTLSGEPLAAAARLSVHEGAWLTPEDSAWSLRGVSGHVRYVEQHEKQRLAGVTPALGRPEATCAALR